MKQQLRIILLMLVACVAQVSYGQDLTKKWAEAAELEKNVTTALLYAQDDNDAASRINSIIQARYMTYDESINHVRSYIKKIKDKLPKWDEKISKGKKLDADDALKAAVCYSSMQDYAKAAKYFEAAAEGAKEDSLKAILRLSAVGCRYQADKDKAAAAAAINFDIPAGSESAMICIARKYGMQDIASEKLQQVFNVNKRQITRAIRSNNIEELKKYEIYDIPEVDSVLALKGNMRKEERESLLRKCMLKHNMAWPLHQLDIENELFNENLSEYVYKCAFYMPINEKHNFQSWEKCWKYDLLRIIYETCQDNSSYVKECARAKGFSGEISDANVYSNVLSFLLLDKLDKYNRRSDAACLSMAILAQFFGTATSEHLPKDVMYDLYDYTASLIKNHVGNDPALLSKLLNGINNFFAEFFTLSADGIAKFKAIDLKTDEGVNKAVNMYLLFAQFIANSKVGKYEPATFDGGNRNFLQLLAYKLHESIESYESSRINTIGLTIGIVIDKEGNVIDIKQMDDNLTKQEREKVISAIKSLPKWKPATRNGQPIRESKIIGIGGDTLKFLQ